MNESAGYTVGRYSQLSDFGVRRRVQSAVTSYSGELHTAGCEFSGKAGVTDIVQHVAPAASVVAGQPSGSCAHNPLPLWPLTLRQKT